MRKIVYLMAHALMAFLFLLAFTCPAMAIEAEYEQNKNFRTYEVEGWSICVIDADIDASAELLTQLATTYAQLAAEDTLEVLSSDALDITQTVTITGIDDSGEKVSESIALDVADGTTVESGTTTFRYVDQVTLDKECVGTITIRRATGDTFITSVPIGYLNAGMAQHFNGEDITYLSGWSCGVLTATGTVLFELRWYPSDADCLDAGDGYIVLDEVYIDAAVTSPYNSSITFPLPIKLPEGGWIAIYGTGGAVNSDGKVIIQGYDSQRYQ